MKKRTLEQQELKYKIEKWAKWIHYILHKCADLITSCLFLLVHDWGPLQVRVTNLHDAAEHIGEVLNRVKKEHLERAYKIEDW